MAESDGHFFDKPLLRKTPKKNVETVLSETEQHTFTKPELRSINKIQTSDGRTDQEGHTFDKPALRGASPGTLKNEDILSGKFDKPTLKSLPGSLASTEKQKTDCTNYGFEKPALKPVEQPEKKGLNLENNDSVKEGEENQRPSWMIKLRKTGNQPVEDKEKPKSCEPEWSQAARNKTSKALQIIQSKGEKEKHVMQKRLRTYPNNKVIVLLKATNCDADVVIIPEIDLGVSTSSSDDKDVVERLSVPVWNGGERKEKHRLYKEITKVLMGLCSKSWKSAGFCINPIGGWSFEHYFKCFLYEINNFYTALSVKYSVDGLILFTNDETLYKLALCIAENYFPDPCEVWSPAENYEHLGTRQDYLKEETQHATKAIVKQSDIIRKPALKPVEQPENKGMDLENNDSVKEGEENQRPSWMINLRKTGNQPVEDKEKPKSSEPEWSQAARNKSAKALQIIHSKENQSQETEKPAAPWVESNLRQSPKSYPNQETNTAEQERLISQTGQKGLLSNISANDSEIVRGARSRSPCTGTGKKKKDIMQKILKTYTSNKVLVLLKATNCDADVVIMPEIDLGVSTSSSDDKDVVERLIVPVWNRGERKEKHRLYQEITKVLMGLCSKSWKSAGFCINPIGGWSFKHYFKCFLYEINNFYTGLSVKYSVECVFLFTNDADLYRLASHIAERYFPDPSEIWSPTENYKHLGTWQDYLKGEKKKHVMQKILRTYPNNKVVILLKATNCDADVVIIPEIDLGVSTSSSDDKDVVERLSVPVWNRGERKEKHRLYQEITKVLMGLCSKSWKSAGFCINPIGGWSFEHYFKCFLYEINNFYTALSVKYSVECVFLFTNDADLYRLASHIAESYFPDPSEIWSPAENYKHLGTWQDYLKGRLKSTDLYVQTGRESAPRDSSRQAPFLSASSDSRPIPARVQGACRIPRQYSQGSFEQPSFMRGLEREHRQSSRHIRSLSVPEENKFSSERVQQTSMPQPSQVSQGHSIQETTSLESEFPYYKMNARPRGCLKSTDLYVQTGRERGPRDSSRQAPSLFGSSESRPIPARVQEACKMQYRQGSFEQPSFMRGLEREHRQSSRHIRSLSVPEENKISSERVQQESMPQPSQISQGHPIQETTSLESEVPYYKMNARPRGICLIISNIEFKKEDLSTRHGTEKDLAKLQNMFSRLHFIVMVRENLNGPDMIRELMDISRRDHTHYDCFVCCILSHGTQDKVYGSDGIPVEIGQLTFMVQPIMCRTLGEKPKLFFIQACQGLQKDEGMEIEVDAGVYAGNMPLIPSNADFLLGYATVRGYVSFRVPDEGTWYISKLVEMLDKYHKSMDLLSILTKVNDEVSKMEVVIDGMRLKQMPSKYSTLRRKLVFN